MIETILERDVTAEIRSDDSLPSEFANLTNVSRDSHAGHIFAIDYTR